MKKNPEKVNGLPQKFRVVIRFVPLPPDEMNRRYNRLQELLFKGARKRADDEEKGKTNE